MARLRDEDVDRHRASTVLRESTRTPAAGRHTHASPTASPAISESSDKENSSQARPKSAMAPPARPTPQSRGAGQHNSKRRRTEEGPLQFEGQDRSESELPFYDPHQDVEERQQVRKGLRDLERDIHDCSGEWLRADSTGLRDALVQQNGLFQKVKQTSDATIDSRFLVQAAVLASKKTKAAALGDGSNGVDVDEFISKCTLFMRKGDELQQEQDAGRGTQGRRVRRTQAESDDEDDAENNGEAHNWAWLGAQACFPVTRRPPVPGFLLGPLSVQKRVRAVTQRRARQARADPSQAVKPRELDVADFQNQESSGVTHMCKNILSVFHRLRAEVLAAVDEGDQEVMQAVMSRNGILDNGGVSLFHFVVDPKSFGQTVENLFYVSFLIKDELVGVEFDSDGMPALMDTEKADEEDPAAKPASSAHRYQAVIGIDFDDWSRLVKTFNIQKSLIEHRAEQTVPTGVGTSGWYGS